MSGSTFRSTALAAALLLTGCLESWTRPVKAPVSALWLDSLSGSLAPSDLPRLREVGVAELILTVGRLDLRSPDGPILPAQDLPSDLPTSLPVTLAIAGEWLDVGADPETAAEGVAAVAHRLRLAFESRGWVPVGLHFDLTAVDSLSTYAAFLAKLQRELDRTLFLSTSLQRDWLARPDVGAVADAVDFVVPFLYGQRVEEAEDGSAWDFIELERKLRLLEGLDTPYLLGVVILGTATHFDERGLVKARRTRISLQEILWNRDLKLRLGFSLAGVNRRVYAVAAERRTRVGSWDVRGGDGVRVVRAATSDLEELTRLLGAWEMPHYLGLAYYRLPAADERLSLSLENLLHALAPSPASPDLALDASLQRRTGRGWLVRFSITNHNGEITELSLMDSNFLEVRCLNGVFGQRIHTGDFYRFDLYRASEDGDLVRTFRRSDVVKLHVPILEGQQRVESGDVEIHVRGEPQLELRGQFLLPDGRTLTVGPHPWPPEAE